MGARAKIHGFKKGRGANEFPRGSVPERRGRDAVREGRLEAAHFLAVSMADAQSEPPALQ